MNYKIIITSLVPTLVTALIAWINHKYDFKGIVKKAEIESRDEIYNSWQKFSETQTKAYNDLKAEFDKNKSEQIDRDRENSKIQSELYEKLTKLQYDFDAFRKNAMEKEQGYQLRIEQLEDENEDLKEKIEVLQGDNESLITENTILKGGQI